MRLCRALQGRISKLAAGFGVDFGALKQENCTGLHPLLYSCVYPEQPDFSAWDAAEAALAQLTEEVLLPEIHACSFDAHDGGSCVERDMHGM